MVDKCDVDIESPSTLFEFGFGTGYLAKELLTKYPQTSFIGVEVSKTMNDLAKQRLNGFDSERVDLHLAKNALGVLQALPDRSIDRFISTYVFDLLPKATMTQIVDTLQRKLKKNGKICLVSLAKNVDDSNVIAKLMVNGWNTIGRFCNICLGGCRPIDLRYPFDVQLTSFKIILDVVNVQFGIPSQILIAEFNKDKEYSKRRRKKK